jgi:hypothetical protein
MIYRRLLAIIFALISVYATAQTTGGMSGIGGLRGAGGAGGGTAAFAGPGDVVSGAIMWAGLRAYSLAKAGTRAANICNSGDANCADINTLANGKFDVVTATGAPLNCGGTGGTCTVKTLYDQTGNTNCAGAACDLTNATAANRPTLTLNCFGTLPCMTFNGTSAHLATSGVVTQSQPLSLSMIANSTNTSVQQTSAELTSSSPRAGYNNSGSNTTFIFAGGVFSATASDGVAHALQYIFNGASSNIVVDGTATSGNAGATNATGTLDLGSNSGAEFFKGTVAEEGFWAVAFTSTQYGNMNSNQHAYWGF